MFNELIKISKDTARSFESRLGDIECYINQQPNIDCLIEQIGIIPEQIPHDSSEEKLFSKASDIILSRIFRELGLKSSPLSERGDSADVYAESKFHNYSLVADAKAFRLSRTAKNQKDFKIAALSYWKKDSDYAILCAPYFQYPKHASQIYQQAIENNVCLLSWDHILFLLKNEIQETEEINLSTIWNFPDIYSQNIIYPNIKKCFLEDFNSYLIKIFLNNNSSIFTSFMTSQINIIKDRSVNEKIYWNNEREKIMRYSREKAIQELINCMKIDEKVRKIIAYVDGLSYAG